MMTEFLRDLVTDGTAFTFVVAMGVLLAAWAWAQGQDSQWPPGRMG